MPPGGDSARDGARRRRGIIVLPDLNVQPARCRQAYPRVGVSPNVPSDLLLPELPVRGGDCLVLAAPMPKAAVNKDRDPGGAEHDVRRSAEVGQWPRVDSVSQSRGMQAAPKLELDLGVSRSLATHALADAGARGHGCRWQAVGHPFMVANLASPVCRFTGSAGRSRAPRLRSLWPSRAALRSRSAPRQLRRLRRGSRPQETTAGVAPPSA